MGINERGINETINDTIDEAKCGAFVSVSVWECECVDYSVVFFYFSMMQYGVQSKKKGLSTISISFYDPKIGM